MADHYHRQQPESTEPSHLCRQCQGISKLEPKRGVQECYRHDLGSFEQAVAEDCYFCLRIWNSLSEEAREILHSPQFTGIKCSIMRYPGDRVGEVGSLLFSFGDEFFDCEDAEDVLNEFTLLDQQSQSRLDELLVGQKADLDL
jgi:hypothetical protein